MAKKKSLRLLHIVRSKICNWVNIVFYLKNIYEISLIFELCSKFNKEKTSKSTSNYFLSKRKTIHVYFNRHLTKTKTNSSSAVATTKPTV